MKIKLLWALSFLPLLITLIALTLYPSEIPVHYDAVGNIDRWGSKYEMLIFPIIIIFMTAFFCFLIYYFKKKEQNDDEKVVESAKQNGKIISLAAFGILILFSIMQFSIMISAFIELQNDLEKMAIDINVVVNVGVGIFLVIIGNYMPKSKRNGIVGLRTVSSMKNDLIWAKSQRFAGILFVITGVATIISAIIIGGIASTIILIILILISAISSSIYANKLAKM